MTTGTRNSDYRYLRSYTMPNGTVSTYRVGLHRYRWWSGGDAITTTKPRLSYPKRPRGPKGSTQVLRPSSGQTGKAGKRLLPPQNYSMRVEDNLDSQFPYMLYDNSYKYWTSQAISDPWSNLSATPDPSEVYKVIAKLREKVYGSGFNPAVFAAEGKQALEMIASSATRIRLGIGALKQGNWRAAVRLLAPRDPLLRKHMRRAILEFAEGKRTLSSLWLEIAYGWKPLLKAAEEGAAFLAYALTEQNPGVAPISASRTWYDNSGFDGMGPDSNIIAWTKRQTRFDLKYTIYGATVKPITVPSLATVASVAWEKLPYSFVADWFIPIGAYIEACRTRSDIKGTIVKSLKKTTDWAGPRCHRRYSLGPDLDGFPRKRSLIEFTRTVSTEISVPPPARFNTDLSDVFKSWQRTGNAVALLTQRKWFAR